MKIFETVRESGSVRNEESISHEDHSYFNFDVECASVHIRTQYNNVNAVTGVCKYE